jgi:hypothetical protein
MDTKIALALERPTENNWSASMKSPQAPKKGDFRLPSIRFHMMSFCDCPDKLDPLEIKMDLDVLFVEVKYRCPGCKQVAWHETHARYSRWYRKKERIKRRFHLTMVALLTSRQAKWIYRRLK